MGNWMVLFQRSGLSSQRLLYSFLSNFTRTKLSQPVENKKISNHEPQTTKLIKPIFLHFTPVPTQHHWGTNFLITSFPLFKAAGGGEGGRGSKNSWSTSSFMPIFPLAKNPAFNAMNCNYQYMKIIYVNCGVKNYMIKDHHSCWRNFCSCEKKAWKQIHASAGFEPWTSAMPVQRSFGWALHWYRTGPFSNPALAWFSFSGFLFATGKVASITAMISFHIVAINCVKHKQTLPSSPKHFGTFDAGVLLEDKGLFPFVEPDIKADQSQSNYICQYTPELLPYETCVHVFFLSNREFTCTFLKTIFRKRFLIGLTYYRGCHMKK